MKILAIEKEIPGVVWDNTESLLKNEALHAYELYLSDELREIYFTENRNAILVLESKDMATAKKILDSFPLVEAGIITFDIMELRPYNGYNRLIKK
ncbi:MAG: superoxide dismutase [Saprospiraceae bacterium]